MSDELIADVEDQVVATSEEDTLNGGDPPLTEKEIKRNFIFLIALDAIYTTGATDFTLALNTLLVYLKASNAIIGLINGMVLPGLLGIFVSPWISKRYPRKKWYYFVSNVPLNLCLGVIGGMLLLSGRLHLTTGFMIAFVFGAVLCYNLCSGFVSLPCQELIAGAIPMSYRGRFTGFGGTICSIFGFLGGGIAYVVLKYYPKPMCYAVLFLITYAFMQGSMFMALFAKERRVPVEKAPNAWSLEMLKAAWQNKPWLRVILLYAMNYLFILPTWNFVTIYGLKGLHMPSETAATMQIIAKATAFVICPIVGLAGDKWGMKRILPAYPILIVLSLIPVLIFHNPMSVYVCAFLHHRVVAHTAVIHNPAAGYACLFLHHLMIVRPAIIALYLCVFLNQVTVNTAIIAFTVLLFGLPRAEHRTGHFTLQILIWNLVTFLGNMLMGKAIDKFGYHHVFTFSAIIGLLLLPVVMWIIAPLSADPKAYEQ